MSPARARGLGVAAAVVALALDQGLKLWMIFVWRQGDRQPFEVTPFLDVRLAWNRGVSYSFLAADGPLGRWALFGGAMLAVAALATWLARARQPSTALALGLLIGGALGNAVDRFAYGAVADFFHLRLDPYLPKALSFLYDYVFNLADVAIVAAVAVLLYETLTASAAPPVGASKSP